MSMEHLLVTPYTVTEYYSTYDTVSEYGTYGAVHKYYSTVRYGMHHPHIYYRMN
jgi:hypothetical protein